MRYEAVNAMLLNEFLKEHHKVEGQAAALMEMKSKISEQELLVGQQQKAIEALTASLREQAAQI